MGPAAWLRHGLALVEELTVQVRIIEGGCYSNRHIFPYHLRKLIFCINSSELRGGAGEGVTDGLFMLRMCSSGCCWGLGGFG